MPTLTERDLAILHSVGTARLLTNREIEWLHFPGWMEREDAHAAAHPGEPYNPSSSVRTRLIHLADARLLTVIPRILHLNQRGAMRLPHLYSLTARGRALLVEAGVVGDPTDLWIAPGRARAIANSEHTALIGRFYAALTVAAASDGHALTDWRGDHRLAQGYDRITVAGFSQPIPVLPDGSGVLVTGSLKRRLFLECDRGTMGAPRWREKVAAQQAYRHSAAYRARFDDGDFFTLIVATTKTRLRQIAETTMRQVREPTYAFLFTTVDQLHPRTIRRCWQRVSAVRWVPRATVRGTTEDATLTFAPVGLWRPPTRADDATPDTPPQSAASEAV
jgi:hypothetical protein